MEAKRGLLDSAKRHAGIAERILKQSPNPMLMAMVENLRLAIQILRSDFEGAQQHGERALAFARESGGAAIIRSCLTNLGNLSYATGDFDKALTFFGLAGEAMRAGGKTSASLDTEAQILLAQDRLDDCASTLAAIDASIHSPEDRILYANRHAELTRARLAARLGELAQALEHIDRAEFLALRAGDSYLSLLAGLSKAEQLQQSGEAAVAVELVSSAIADMVGQSPELFAQSERVLACGLVDKGRRGSAEAHYLRARRIYDGLGGVPADIELQRRWRTAICHQDESNPAVSATAEPQSHDDDRSPVHSAAAVFLFPDRPELVARELLELLRTTNCVHSAAVVARAADGTETTLAEIAAGSATHDDDAAPPRRLSIGFAHDRAIDLVVQPKADIESAATVNAVTLLLSTVHNLERARLEREERATLWPIEELPIEGEHAVIAGHMRERMNLARRVAPAKVIVLVTGESGTGKEILARAVHDYSERAAKPFVAFNCAAIPRDLLESQLFGHRRGAFTGADRDHTGVIRSARDGTLFLDEIGELSLDLQPKLLRFLESGEIAPLGEAPTTVDVRLVAATNTSLEEAVRAGKFREDLFYRLNVVRLSLKPLRERRDEIAGLAQYFVSRAALEYHKGNVRISDETIERLLLYRWPGNVRQLQNEVRRMVALAEPDSTLEPDAIDEDILGALPLRSTLNGSEMAISLHDKLTPTLARIECEMIKAALSRHRGKVDVVAKALGISRKGLYLKRQRLGL